MKFRFCTIVMETLHLTWRRWKFPYFQAPTVEVNFPNSRLTAGNSSHPFWWKPTTHFSKLNLQDWKLPVFLTATANKLAVTSAVEQQNNKPSAVWPVYWTKTTKHNQNCWCGEKLLWLWQSCSTVAAGWQSHLIELGFDLHHLRLHLVNICTGR